MKIDLRGFIEKATLLRVLSVMVAQNGVCVAQHHWEDRFFRNVYSVTKSFTSAAVGIAQQEGLLRIDEKLVDAFASDLPEQVSEHLQKATVRDLLTMCLGQKEAHMMGGARPYYREEDWVKMALAFPFDSDPGTKFLYSNVGPYLAGVLVERRAGCDLESYLKPRLFEPMGIRCSAWERDPRGHIFGSSGLFLCPDDLLKFGQLYLQNGNWNGRQLVPEAWVQESTKNQVGDLLPHGYGYLFWGDEYGGFRADGAFCQLSMIMREKNAVVATVAECRDGDALRAAIYSEIYPQL